MAQPTEISKLRNDIAAGNLTNSSLKRLDSLLANFESPEFLLVPSSFLATCNRLVHIIDVDFSRSVLTSLIHQTGLQSRHSLSTAIADFIEATDEIRNLNGGVLPVEPKGFDMNSFLSQADFANQLTRNFIALAFELDASLRKCGSPVYLSDRIDKNGMAAPELTCSFSHFFDICDKLRKSLGDNVPVYQPKQRAKFSDDVSNYDMQRVALVFENGSRIETDGSGQTPNSSDQDFTPTHPAHYNASNIATFDVVDDWDLGFYAGNAVKYIQRAGKKDPETEIEDLEKAIVYLQNEIRIRQQKGDC